MSLLRSLAFGLFQAASLLVWGSLFLLLAPFLSDHARYRLAMRWPGMVIWAARWLLGIEWRLEGQEHLEAARGKPMIVCSKHQSAWETLFLPSHMPVPLCFVFKKELLKIPFFGWSIALLPMIHVDRSQGRQAFEQIQSQPSHRLDQGFWITFFPEGTRIRPGQRVKYKTGAARLACSLGLPILPIALNAGTVWPRNAWIKRPGCITVRVGPPIPTDGQTPEAVMQTVQAWIDEQSDALH